MKKVLAIVAVCLLLVGALALSAFAKFENSKVTATPDKVVLHRGEEFEVYVSLENTEAISAAGTKMEFSKDVVVMVDGFDAVDTSSDKRVKVNSGSDLDGMACAFALTKSNQEYSMVVNGDIFCFIFQVKDDAPFGTVTVNPKTGLDDGNYIESVPFTIEIACDGVNHEFTQEKEHADFLKAAASCEAPATYYKSCQCGAKGTETFTVGEKLNHSFKELVKDTALKSGATCTSAAVYYKSCDCGELSSETFTSGSPLAHDFTKQTETEQYLAEPATCSSKAKYYLSCSVCDASSNDLSKTFTVGSFASHDYEERVQINPDGHHFNINTSATCSSPATYHKICKDCGMIDFSGEPFSYGDPADHKYTREIKSNETLKSAATCQAPDTYYKTCQWCNVHSTKDTDTFTDGQALAHTYDKTVAEDTFKKSGATCTAKAVYYKSCVCGAFSTTESATFESGEKLPHTYDQQNRDPQYLVNDAACGNPAIYKLSCVCGLASETETFTYGEPGAHVYTVKTVKPETLKSAATCESAAVYYYSCSCGAISTNAADTFTDGLPQPHVYEKERVEDAYLKSGATCTAKAVYYKSCNTCTKAGTETFESGEKLPHTYDKTVAEDTFKKSGATCTAKAVYYKSCVCGAFSTTESATFESGATLSHVYENERAEDTYLKSGATCIARAVYYKSCNTCTAAGTETFESGNFADHKMTVYTRVDDKKHTVSCSVPGCTESEEEDHDISDELIAGTETHWTACKCGEKGAESAHTFDKKVADKAFEKSGATCTAKAVYYVSCACGAKGTETFESGEVAAHKLSAVAGKPATTAAAGYEAHYQCDDCKALFADDKAAKPIEKPVEIPQLKAENPETGDESLVVATVLLLALSACGVAAVLVLKKRNAI